MRYVAFLRAINVSGRFVRMERLRRAFKEMGYSNIETHIQSGNVLFESNNLIRSELEHQIEFGLQGILGFPVPAFVRTDREMIDLIHHQPMIDVDLAETNTLYVVFLHSEPLPEVQKTLRNESSDINRFYIHKNQIFWLYNRSLGESTFSNAKLEKILRVPATLRNISTLQKIAEKFR